MNRRDLFLSTAKAALATALGGSWLSGAAQAQTSPRSGLPLRRRGPHRPADT